MWWALPSSSVV